MEYLNDAIKSNQIFYKSVEFFGRYLDLDKHKKRINLVKKLTVRCIFLREDNEESVYSIRARWVKRFFPKETLREKELLYHQQVP